MYWLSFLILTVVLYTPRVGLAWDLWRWAARHYWAVPVIEWPWPAWAAYTFWLTVAYLALGTLLHLLHRRLPADSRLGRAIRRLSHSSLGTLGVVAPLVAAVTLLLAWPVLPACGALYGWRYAISPPVAALASLYLLAEAMRIVEDNTWADRDFAAWRISWLVEHGHYR